MGPSQSQQLPTGGSVAAGSATISSPNTSTLNINQSTNRAIINWQGFSVGAGGTVNFNQPGASSATLNRVLGTTPSTIAGTINAPGTVLLVNPNGIAITRTGVVNVGSFAASTLDIKNEDFLAGNYKFIGTGSSARVVNGGRINVSDGGFAALLGGQVANNGVISARLGKVALGSGELITLDLAGDGFLSVAVPSNQIGNLRDGSGRALVSNRGKIRADGGAVFLSAATATGILRDAVNVPGSIRANSVGSQNGRIFIGGGAGGNVKVSGRLQAAGGAVNIGGKSVDISGKVNVSAAKGGTISVAADDNLRVSGQLSAVGHADVGGRIDLTASNVTLASALIDASGATGGGLVRIGGTFQGGNGDPNDPLYQAFIGRFGSLADVTSAQIVIVDENTRIDVSAKTAGDGGTAIVWSDLYTGYAGTITARGSNGGFAEVSGKEMLDYIGTAELRASAAGGATGTLLLDPFNVIIQATGTLNPTGTDPRTYTATSNSTINATTLQTNLENANVVISTGTTGGGAGSITVNASLFWASNRTLTLNASNNASGTIAINQSITANNGGLTLRAGSNGAITATAAVSVNTFTLVSGNWTQNVAAPAALPNFSATNFVVSGGSFLRAAGGDGTSGNPYTIMDVFGLQGIATGFNWAGRSYNLGANIDASGTTNWNAGKGFVPIGGADTGNIFQDGIFDGRGFTISGLTINLPDVSAVGLFGYSGATIQNVNLTNVDITGAYGVGALVGYDSGGSIINSSATGTVNGTFNNNSGLGGLVGVLSGTMSNSWANVTVNAPTAYNVGGLVGANVGGTITNSYAAGNVSGARGTGGLVGSNYGSIIGSYASGNVTPLFVLQQFSNTGGLVGENSGTIDTSYATGNVNGDISSVGGTSWNYGGLVGLNTGSITNSYALGNVSGLSSVGGLVGSNGFDINSGLGGTITNSYARGNVTGDSQVGGFAGSNGGEMWVEQTPGNWVPVGVAATITNSNHTTGTVTGAYITGGFVGENIAGEISRSYAKGTVVGDYMVGGFVGRNNDPGSIHNAYATGSVTGSTFGVGGFVGENFGSIVNAYASGAVTGTAGCYCYTGGFAGLIGNGTVQSVYSVGTVSGGLSWASGAFVGWHAGGTTTSAYWDTDKTAGLGGIGYFDVGGSAVISGLDTTTFKSALPAGFSDTVWGIIPGQTYPFLLWQPGIVSGTLYGSYGGSAVSAGFVVNALIDGANAQSALTNSSGRYFFFFDDALTSGSQLLVYSSSGATYVQNVVPDTLGPVAIYNGWLNIVTPSATSSTIATGLATAIGADAPASTLVSGLTTNRVITATGASFAINAPISLNSLVLYANGAVTQSAAITATNLALFGTGSFTLTNTSNQIGTLAGNVGSLNLTNSIGLTIGTVAGTSNLTSSGAVTLTGNSLTLNGTTGQILAAGQTVTIRPLATSGTMRLGTGSGTLLLTQASLDSTTAAQLVFGGSSSTGSIMVGGSVSIPSSIAMLTLQTTGAITFNVGSTVTAVSAASTLDVQGGSIITFSGSINMPGALQISTTGSLTPNGSISVGLFDLLAGNWIQNSATLPAFFANDFRVGSNASFLRVADGDGSSSSPYLVVDIYGLQGFTTGTYWAFNNFNLANNIDASSTANWNSGAGFVPIGGGEANNIFQSAVFDGKGFTISGLTINRPNTDRIGLFGYSGTTVQNVNLVNVNITGRVSVGGLVGYSDSSSAVSNSTVSGTVAGYFDVGGLVGTSFAPISNSSAAVTVTGEQYVGGLAGYSAGSITQSYATGNVISTLPSNAFSDLIAGGLIGQNSGSVSLSYATGTVSGSVLGTLSSGFNVQVGGLIGRNDGSVTTSYAEGAVSGSIAAFAPGGSSTGGVYVGGLVGLNAGSTISQSYATGNVAVSGGSTANTTSRFVSGGGLVGFINAGSVSDSYAMARVTGTAGSTVGGLVGRISVTGSANILNRTYATGAVTGGTVGGIAGVVGTTAVSRYASTYYDSQTTGAAAAIGNGTGSGTANVSTTITARTTAQLQSGLPLNFSDTVWGIVPTQTYPFLLFQPGVLTGTVYSTLGGSVVGGALVTALLNGVAVTSVTTSASGVYVFWLGTIPAGANVVAYTSGGLSYRQDAPANVSGLNIYGSYLAETTSATTFSALSAGLTAGIGGNVAAQNVMAGLTNLLVSPTGATFAIDQAVAAGIANATFGSTASPVAMTVSGTVSMPSSLLNLTLATSAGGSITVGSGSSLTNTAANGSITFQSNALTIGGNVAATGANGAVTILPSTNAFAIQIGGSGANRLLLSTATIGNIVATTLTIGSTINSSTIMVSANVTLPSGTPTSGSGITNLRLITTGAITIGASAANTLTNNNANGSITLQTNANPTITGTLVANATSGTVNILPIAAGTVISLGTGTSGIALTAAELGQIRAANLVIGGGSAQSGGITVTSTTAITLANVTNLTLQTTGTISFSTAATSLVLSQNNASIALLTNMSPTLTGIVNAGPSGRVTIATISDAGSIRIGATGTATIGLTQANLNQIRATTLVLGRSTATGAITVTSGISVTASTFTNLSLLTGGAITVNSGASLSDTIANGTLLLQGGTLTLTGAVSVNNSTGTLILDAAGNVGQTAAITAARLLLLNGSFTLTTAANSVGTLAANAAALNYAQNGSLTIGGVGSTSGVTSTGAVTMATGGNLTIAAGSMVTGTQVVLSAIGNFINGQGSDAVAASTRWLIYSNNPAGNTFNGLDSNNTAIWNATLASLPPGSVSEPGNRYIFAFQPTVTFTSTDVAKTYGDTVSVASAYTVSVPAGVSGAFLADNAADVYSGAPALSSLGTAADADVGSHTITVSTGTLAALKGYQFGFASIGNVNITQRAITVTAVSGQSRIYGDNDPVWNYTTSDLGGGVALNGALTTNTTTQTGIGSSYSIDQGTITNINNPNYLISYTPANMTITPRPLTVTGTSFDRVYGDNNPATTTAFSAPTGSAGSGAGLVNGDTIGSVTVTSLASDTSDVGAYGFTPGGAQFSSGNINNYAITYADGALNVTPRPLTVTGGTINRVYGDNNLGLTTAFSAPTGSAGSGSGLVNGDTIGIVTVTSLASNTSDVGAYGFTPGSALFLSGSAGNYAITYADGALNVTPRPLTVTGGTINRVYGDNNPATTTAFSAPTGSAGSGSGLVNGDTIGSVTVTSSADNTTGVGGYSFTPGSASFSSGNINNYTVVYVDGALNVTARPLVVTGTMINRVYGDNNPATTMAFSAPAGSAGSGSGLVNGDAIGSVTVTSLADNTTGVGGYSFTPGSASFSSGNINNYAITYVDGALNVTARPLTVTGGVISRIYGDNNPSTTANFSALAGSAGSGAGLVNGDTIGSVSVTSLADNTIGVGAYNFTPGNASFTSGQATNYQITYVDGALNVTPRPLTVTGTSFDRVYGDNNPATTTAFAAPTGSAGLGNGLVNGDTIGAVAVNTLANQSSDVGLYSFTPGSASFSSGSAGNYQITYLPGTLNVTQALLVFTATPASRPAGEPNPPLTGTIAGFKNGQTAATFGGDIWATTADTSSPIGLYPITGSLALASPNYLIMQASGNATALSVGTATVDHGQTPSNVNVPSTNNNTTNNNTTITFQNNTTTPGPTTISFTPPSGTTNIVTGVGQPQGTQTANNGFDFKPLSQFDLNQYSQFVLPDFAPNAGQAAILTMIARAADPDRAANFMIDLFWNGTGADWNGVNGGNTINGKVTFSNGQGDNAIPDGTNGFPIVPGTTDFGLLLSQGPVMIGGTDGKWVLATGLSADGKSIVANDPATGGQVLLSFDAAAKTLGGITATFNAETNSFVPVSNAGNGVSGTQGFVPASFFAVTIQK